MSFRETNPQSQGRSDLRLAHSNDICTTVFCCFSCPPKALKTPKILRKSQPPGQTSPFHRGLSQEGEGTLGSRLRVQLGLGPVLQRFRASAASSCMDAYGAEACRGIGKVSLAFTRGLRLVFGIYELSSFLLGCDRHGHSKVISLPPACSQCSILAFAVARC